MRQGSSRRLRRHHPRTLWSLAVLGLLREQPMHPYEMQRQLHLRHTDELLALKRGSIYHAINQLLRSDLIEALETSREGRWPERTVYRLTADGEHELATWLGDLLSTPVREPSAFTAGLAHIRKLEPLDALEHLQLRIMPLQAGIAAMHAIEGSVAETFGRASVLELEYSRAVAEAELSFVRGLVDDLRAQRLTWTAGSQP
jgi:DNA-binding PadR family transcriptional regulator